MNRGMKSASKQKTGGTKAKNRGNGMEAGKEKTQSEKEHGEKMKNGKAGRKDQARQLYQESKTDFLCPQCRENLILDETGNFRCKKGHCFDLSAKGYVNFIPGQKPVNYGKELFEYRQKVFEQGFYQRVAEEIEEILICHLGLSPSGGEAASHRADSHGKAAVSPEFKYESLPAKEKKLILDVGCGEGYYSRWLSRAPGLSGSCRFFSMDIAKDAIRLAALKGEGIGLMIADLARLPFKRKRVDALLNILTPANYQEFFRVLKEDGILIKVIPGSQYLQEVRNAVSGQLIRKEYSNQSVLEYFREHAQLLEQKTVLQTFPVDQQTAAAFLRMTPMTGQVDFSKVREEEIRTITIHLEILVGTAGRQRG